jgi:hypothetical protein
MALAVGLALAACLQPSCCTPYIISHLSSPPPQKTQDGDYGKTRVFGAWGWGLVGAVSGWAVGRFGAAAAFGGYLLLAVPCVWLACLMECDPLKGKREAAAAAAAAAAAGGGADGSAAEAGRRDAERGSFELARRADAAGRPQPSSDQAVWRLSESGSGGGGDEDTTNTTSKPSELAASRVEAAAATGTREAYSQPPRDDEGAEEAAPLLSPDPVTQQQSLVTASSNSTGTSSDLQPSSSAPASRAVGVAAAGGGARALPPSYRARLCIMMSCPAVWVLLSQACVMGFGIGVIGDLLFIYLEVGGMGAASGVG